MLLVLSLSSVLPRVPFLAPPRADVLDRLCLFRRDGLAGCGLDDDDDELSSETTRARENPHMLHDVAAIDGRHYVRRRCTGYVGVPQRGVACC